MIHLQYLQRDQKWQKAGDPCSIHCTGNVLSQMNNTCCCMNINEHVIVIKSSVSEVTAWWSGPGSPQRLTDRSVLVAHTTRHCVGLLENCGGATWVSVAVNTTGPTEGRIQPVLGPVYQHAKERSGRLSENQRAGRFRCPVVACRIRVWASSERCIQSCTKPQAFPLRSQELSGSL